MAGTETNNMSLKYLVATESKETLKILKAHINGTMAKIYRSQLNALSYWPKLGDNLKKNINCI